MTTEHSGEYSSEHSSDPIIHSTGDSAHTEAKSSGTGHVSSHDMTGSLRADTNHPELLSQTSTQRQHPDNASDDNDGLSAFVFRVECPGSPPHRLQLTGNQYTLGSAEGCSIRLRDENVLPLHATIRHTADELFIEGHNEQVVVNGDYVDRCQLSIGDTLQLGSYRFKLVSNQRVSDTAKERPVLTNVLPPEVEKALARSNGRKQAAFTQDSNNLQELVTQSRLEACVRREQLCEKREAKLEDDRSNLKFRESDLAKRLARLEAEESASLELYDQLSKRQAEINSLRASLQEKESLHLQRETEYRNKQMEFEQELSTRSAQIESAQIENSLALEKIESLAEEVHSLRKELTETEQQRDLLELREQLQRKEHEHLVRQLETDRDQMVSERAEHQAKLRSMESSLQDLESLVASAESLDSQVDDNLEIAPESDTAGSESNLNAESLGDHPSPKQLEHESLRQYMELSQENAKLIEELIELRRERDEKNGVSEQLSEEVDESSSIENQPSDDSDDSAGLTQNQPEGAATDQEVKTESGSRQSWGSLLKNLGQTPLNEIDHTTCSNTDKNNKVAAVSFDESIEETVTDHISNDHVQEQDCLSSEQTAELSADHLSGSQNAESLLKVQKESVEEAVHRLLNQENQKDANHEEAPRIASPISTQARVDDDEATEAQSMTSRVITSIQTILSSEKETSRKKHVSDQAILMRYAFAFAAVIIGFICYRIVPGHIRYIAVIMALALAAIYTSEGLSMSRHRASR